MVLLRLPKLELVMLFLIKVNGYLNLIMKKFYNYLIRPLNVVGTSKVITLKPKKEFCLKITHL